MNVLVTGGSGFVGRSLIRTLEKSGHKVFNYDLELGLDIRDKFKLYEVFEANNFDVVVHMAARAGVSKGEEFPEEYFSTNVIGTNNLINACETFEVDNFIFFSSSSVLGGTTKKAGSVELEPMRPKAIYGITKADGEILTRRSSLNYIVIRPFTVYGENGRRDMVIYKWIEAVKKGNPIIVYKPTVGTTSRGYTYVGDLVNGVHQFVNLMGSGVLFKQTFNLGGDEVISIDRMVELFEKMCIKKGLPFETSIRTILPYDIKDSYADTSKVRGHIVWNPKKIFEKRLLGILKREL